MQQLCNNVPFKNFPPLIKIRQKYPSKLHQTSLNSSGDCQSSEIQRKQQALGIVVLRAWHSEALRRLFCASN